MLAIAVERGATSTGSPSLTQQLKLAMMPFKGRSSSAAESSCALEPSLGVQCIMLSENLR